MKHSIEILISAFVASVTLVSCADMFEEAAAPNNPETVTKGEPSGTLESGLPLKAGLDGGLAPLTFLGTVNDTCIGEVYMDDGAEFPDLFFMSQYVTRGLSRGDQYGINMCRYEGMSEDGCPVYSAPVHINSADTPWATHLNFGANLPVIKVASFMGKIYGFELKQANSDDGTQRTMKFRAYEFNPETLSFSQTGANVNMGDIPHNAAGFTFRQTGNNTLRVCILTHDGMESYKTDRDGTDESLYDGAGFYEGLMLGARVFTSDVTMSANGTTLTSTGLTEGSVTGQDLLLSATDITSVTRKSSSVDGYVAISKLGTMKYLPAKKLRTCFHMSDTDGNDLEVPNCAGGVITVTENGSEDALGIITSGEGCKYWFRLSGKMDANGAPIFNPCVPLMMRNGELFSGSLCVPSVADWDGDGALDIISGNSEGRLLFFKNYGSDAQPEFGQPERLKSDGQEICFRSGYYEIQSPYESIWGYLCPTVFDWNGDGLPDVVFSHNEGKYEVMLNIGSRTTPELGRRRSLTLDGMELYGLWRVRPAVVRCGEKVYLATVDGDNEIHLYRKASDTSVEDLGKAVLKNGMNISGHRANLGRRLGGEQGRMKLEFADWDGDGTVDLLLGHASGGSVPFPSAGFPVSVGNNMQCMWLRNVGTNDNMVFDYPVLLGFRGGNYNIGSHSNVPVICPLGGGKNLLVGTESGKMYFFNRSDVTELTQYNYLFNNY